MKLKNIKNDLTELANHKPAILDEKNLQRSVEKIVLYAMIRAAKDKGRLIKALLRYGDRISVEIDNG